uniref:Uncharacterized protein n=1 Tax=Rhizophora mucronata TaxID=61149 RepID=A0A2P2MXA8_RHIMU
MMGQESFVVSHLLLVSLSKSCRKETGKEIHGSRWWPK